jgi:hypothetical protein
MISDTSLPDDIWHVPETLPNTCFGASAAAGGGADGGGVKWPYEEAILGGSATFTADVDDGGMRIRVVSEGSTWLGIGVPAKGETGGG